MKKRKFTKLQQQVYDAVMKGETVSVLWPTASGRTYLYNALKEDLQLIATVFEEQFVGERRCYYCSVVTTAREEFGKGVTEETMQAVVQNILDRYCSPEYFSPEELKAISKNDF